MQKTLILVTCLLMAVSFPHALEDFHYGDLSRLGISLPLGVLALATAYALQVIGIALTLRGKPLGAPLVALMGLVWCVGAIVIHGHDVLFAGPHYRHGPISRVLELSIIALGGAAAVFGVRAWGQTIADPP